MQKYNSFFLNILLKKKTINYQKNCINRLNYHPKEMNFLRINIITMYITLHFIYMNLMSLEKNYLKL